MKRSIIMRLVISIIVMSTLLVVNINPQKDKTQVIENNQQTIKTENNKIDDKNSKSTDKKVDESQIANDSMFDTIKQGGLLMIPIVLLGFLGLTLILERLIFFIRQNTFSREPLKKHIEHLSKNSSAQCREELEDELREGSQIYFNKMEKGMALLSGVGNLAPLLGFFGTVVGMIGAFASIAAATTVNAKVVAVGIQTALVTTASGLSVAVPTLGFYYLFNHFIQKAYAFSDEYISEATKDKKRMSQM